MSPAKKWHQLRESRIASLLNRLMPQGEVVAQPPLRTREGTKVADVSWFSEQRLVEVGVSDDEAEFLIAADIMIEVLSYSNSDKEMAFKRTLYFELGAVECWLCDLEGQMTFWDVNGPIDQSKLCPEFPKVVRRRGA